MKKLTIDLEHCYGIKKLSTTFDFSQCSVYAIYAPNGVMKSCFAQTFKDIATSSDSRDRVFPTRKTRRDVVDEAGKPLESDAVLVLPPYDEFFGGTDKTATLLVDASLRKEYERLFSDIEKTKGSFLKAMKSQSKSKRDLELEIARTFTRSDNEFYRALIRVKDEVAELPEPQFADVPYDLIADERVAEFLESGDVKSLLQDYIDQYNALLDQSKYFRKGTFDYYNASTIAKALAKNGFFKANHSVTLNAERKVEVTDEKQLAKVIAEEKAQILENADLRRTFDEMEKRITKNGMLRDFQDFIADNEEVLALMGNLDKLKEDVWKSYFKEHESIYLELIAKYQAAESRRKEIQTEAARQRTQWEDVVEIFNRRFFVPFKLEVTNRVSVILGQATVPSLGFVFHEDGEQANIDRSDLLAVLSTGEKKALYILNVIFEIEVRRQSQDETVFVVDDIADSFDYKNKYAIIQYLKDVSEEPCFRQIILTHNFDFFRTIQSRFVRYSHCKMAERTSNGLSLIPAAGVRNVFVNDWKKCFFEDPKKRVASIAFIRNLIEYTRGEDEPDFEMLTGLLHWKSISAGITHSDLDGIYARLFATTGQAWGQPDGRVLDTILAEADECLDAPEGARLENKIVLAISIRLLAEKYMIEKIADDAFVESIKANQTSTLLHRYKSLPGCDREPGQILDEVALMTPENIHLNSFMYEPIIDMSDAHLRELFTRVRTLA